MNKIICEICGTVYPDNATMCPICGYPRSIGEDTQAADEQLPAAKGQNSTRVRGGKFSNSNVKKRNQSASRQERAVSTRSARPEPRQKQESEPRNNRSLVITVAVLLAAVIFVGAYIGLRFFLGSESQQKPTEPPASVATEATTEPTVPEETSVACTDLQISDLNLDQGVEFLGKGRAWRLKVTTVPANTTDVMTVACADESVATVSVDAGVVEVVSVDAGRTTITITCGSVIKNFPVNCNFEGTEPTAEPTEETTEPTEQTTEPTEAEKTGLDLNRSDITLFKKGETFTFSAGRGISNAQVTWSTSDETVATIDNGKVTAVSGGVVTITATYNGEKDTCIVRCSLPEETEPTETTEPTEPTESTEATEPSADSSWKISHSDVSIEVGESFRLTLKNSSGQTASVSWSGGDAVSISGNTITGAAAGTVTVSCTYEGKTFSCIVRVK